METDWFLRIIFLFVLILFSAFFSGSEVALFSLEKKLFKDLRSSKEIIEKYIFNLLESPRRLLVTILVGNTVTNVAASILAVTIALDIAKYFNYAIDFVLVVQIIVLTILILIFGEITPKLFASKNPLLFSKIVSIPLYWIGVIIYPIAKIITDLVRLLAASLNLDKTKIAISSSEITELADIGVEKGTIEEDEHELIHGLVSFKSITVREVMTPRVDIKSVSVENTFSELMALITESGHSRIPLYNSSLDNIIGIIYAKDLLPYIKSSNGKKEISLKEIVREALFIPESKLISDLLHEFQEMNMHVGIVVDEYGGTAGLVTLEDILEEIVGEIRDEYDKEENEITKLSETSYVVLGKVLIDELNELLEEDFSSENDDYDTVGGFIFNHFGIIPEEGDNFEHLDFRFSVKEINNKRINKVLIEKLPGGTEN